MHLLLISLAAITWNTAEVFSSTVICKGVFCSLPLCKNAYIPHGKCCPVCPTVNDDKSCYYKGHWYKSGASFKDECNTCWCRNGRVRCTQKPCPPKPGHCPTPTGNGICVLACKSDYDCAGIEKCCSNGCGHVCTVPVCLYKGIEYKQGAHFKDGCNTCTCRGGIVSCTENICPPPNPCDLVQCATPTCQYYHTPAGQCCPVCEDVCYYQGKKYEVGNTVPVPNECNNCHCSSGGKIICVDVACPQVHCSNPIIPPGQCCQVCPPNPDPCHQVNCQPLSCSNQHTPNGQCCPVCSSGCYYNGVHYEEDETVPTNNPCDKCTCRNSIVNCYQKTCKPVQCDEPYIKHGDCCESCPDNAKY